MFFGWLSTKIAQANKKTEWAKNRKTFKQFRLLNGWIDFEIILQECSLGDPLLKLLKPFRSAE